MNIRINVCPRTINSGFRFLVTYASRLYELPDSSRWNNFFVVVGPLWKRSEDGISIEVTLCKRSHSIFLMDQTEIFLPELVSRLYISRK